MPQPALQDFKATCAAILAAGASKFSPTWDDRFGAVLLQLDKSDASLLHSILEKQFPTPWSSQTLADAPPSVRQIAESLGGVEARQELFVTDPGQPVCLVAAWWPWQGGSRVSVRFVLRAKLSSSAELNQELRTWFGV